MYCTNLMVLQVESKFGDKGIFSTMVDVFNLYWFHTVVSLYRSRSSSGKLEFFSDLMSGF